MIERFLHHCVIVDRYKNDSGDAKEESVATFVALQQIIMEKRTPCLVTKRGAAMRLGLPRFKGEGSILKL